MNTAPIYGRPELRPLHMLCEIFNAAPELTPQLYFE